MEHRGEVIKIIRVAAQKKCMSLLDADCRIVKLCWMKIVDRIRVRIVDCRM